MICEPHLARTWQALLDRRLELWCTSDEREQHRRMNEWCSHKKITATNFEPLLLALEEIIRCELQQLGHHAECALCHLIHHNGPEWNYQTLIDRVADQQLTTARSLGLLGLPS